MFEKMFPLKLTVRGKDGGSAAFTIDSIGWQSNYGEKGVRFQFDATNQLGAKVKLESSLVAPDDLAQLAEIFSLIKVKAVHECKGGFILHGERPESANVDPITEYEPLQFNSIVTRTEWGFGFQTVGASITMKSPDGKLCKLTLTDDVRKKLKLIL